MSAVKNIAILDDNFEIVVLFRTFLSRMGYHVSVFTKPEEALEHIQRHPPDLIITDLSMPGMSGSEVIRKARKAGYAGQIIVITAFPNMADVQVFSENQVFKCLLKPVFMKQMEETVLAALGDTAPEQ